MHNANTLAGIGKKVDPMKTFKFTGNGGKLMEETPLDPQLLTIRKQEVVLQTPTK